MKLVILGCGRVGARLAVIMQQDGHEVSIIDANPDAFKRLPDTFTGETVLGTGIDTDVLRAAGIDAADAFAACTNGDNTNIMACEIAKEIFSVPKVLARIYDPGREGFYHDLGLDTVCPTTLVSTRAREILTSGTQTEDLDIKGALRGDLSISSAQPPSDDTMPDVTVPAVPGATSSSAVVQETQPPARPAVEKEKSSGGLRGMFRG